MLMIEPTARDYFYSHISLQTWRPRVSCCLLRICSLLIAISHINDVRCRSGYFSYRLIGTSQSSYLSADEVKEVIYRSSF